ncbi:MAG TPA: alkaline phosphatase D family protein [Actinophytocola sp.]|uniref:alkaline phosphatase D family protein n=1 Tax=Actinophytocola sp. TaxID=1872138 RepID=UPI002DBD25DD|nr:alkaline phosphatase D family protein [Actinophytocola sp.]HEU5471297.1 alkaline phosphatase D family protein [Actinophytocola sp.]
MAGLVLGPLLRHVDQTSATVWVETDGPCAVDVLDGTARTFEVSGHHFALVILTGLRPGTSTPYEVRLDGEPVWPPPRSPLPYSRIRTPPSEDDALLLVFGSCRKPLEVDALGPDALSAYARRMAGRDESEWPRALLLLGDQVYADETSDATQEWLAQRRDISQPPGTEVTDFAEYAHLYHEAWSEPTMRWLLSTVPTSMIFDDHDVRDDWNTSHAWQRKMRRQPWWTERLRAAIASYWVYQHIGNLGPADLAADPTFQKVVRSGRDNQDLLVAFADEADNEVDGTKGARWSYRRDFGRTRLLVIDTRAGRILAGGTRSMVDEDEFAWIEDNADGDIDHLLVGSSLPWLLPHTISDLQSINERACRRPGWRGRFAEWLRQTLDLEHWAAFRASFDRLTRLIARVGRQPDPPATIAVLSGDVHHAYVTRATFAEPVGAAVYQITCSPIHNTVPGPMRLAFRAGWWAPLAAVSLRWARRAGVPAAAVDWSRISGPHFGNAVTTISLSGRTAVTTIERATGDGLVPLAEVTLAG